MISKSQEEYLKTIYILKQQTGKPRVTDIATRMNCSKPSVNKVLKQLKEEKLINYESYGDIELTEEGIKLSKKILEAYDIVNVFLTEILGVEKPIAEEDAKKMKMVMSDKTLNSLAKYINKELGLNNLECGYDINNTRCIECTRRKGDK